MPMPAVGVNMSSALNASSVDSSNNSHSQAMNLLGEILGDSDLQNTGKAFARYFWYGIVLAVAIAALLNIVQKITLRLRWSSHSIGDARGMDANIMLESALQLLICRIQQNRGTSSPYP